MRVHVYASMCTVGVCTHIQLCVYTYTCISVRVCTCVYVSMCACLCGSGCVHKMLNNLGMCSIRGAVVTAQTWHTSVIGTCVCVCVCACA